jgi:hypothetical protein
MSPKNTHNLYAEKTGEEDIDPASYAKAAKG